MGKDLFGHLYTSIQARCRQWYGMAQQGVLNDRAESLPAQAAHGSWLLLIKPPLRAGVYALALSNSAISSGLSSNDAARTRLSTWSGVVALAIGAVTPGRAITQASATSAGLAE